MTLKKQQLLKKLKTLQTRYDTEANHAEADKLLLDFIDDKKITEAFNDIQKWYA